MTKKILGIIINSKIPIVVEFVFDSKEMKGENPDISMYLLDMALYIGSVWRIDHEMNLVKEINLRIYGLKFRNVNLDKTIKYLVWLFYLFL